jgi:DNA-binding transcriptional regulator YhcF (GntR family)
MEEIVDSKESANRPKKEGQQASSKKWGKAVLGLGFCVIPSLLLRGQARLGISPVQLVILLHIIDHWWYAEQLPFPSKASIASRCNLSPRQVQRYLTELEDRGYIKRVDRFVDHKGQQSNYYDLSGLVAQLKRLEPEFSSVEELRKAVAKRGGLASLQADIAKNETSTKL